MILDAVKRAARQLQVEEDQLEWARQRLVQAVSACAEAGAQHRNATTDVATQEAAVARAETALERAIREAPALQQTDNSVAQLESGSQDGF